MTEPEDLVVSLIREMRKEMAERFDAVERRFDLVDKRLEEIDLDFSKCRSLIELRK